MNKKVGPGDGNLMNTTSYGNGALYVKDLIINESDLGDGVVLSIFNYSGYTLNIYYDPTISGFNGDYAFASGKGELIAKTCSKSPGGQPRRIYP